MIASRAAILNAGSCSRRRVTPTPSTGSWCLARRQATQTASNLGQPGVAARPVGATRIASSANTSAWRTSAMGNRGTA